MRGGPRPRGVAHRSDRAGVTRRRSDGRHLGTVSAVGEEAGAEVPVQGPWTIDRVHAHLDDARIPVRLAFLDDDGHPRVLSLWFRRRAGHLWCATQRTAVVATALARDGRVGFEVAADTAPYRGVRGRGRAHLRPGAGAEVLGALMDRYLEPDDPLRPRLLDRADQEVAIEIVPEGWFSWDFTGRMGAGRD